MQRDGEWVEVLTLTPDQMSELETATDERLGQIVNQLRQPPSAADAATAQAIYDQHKIEGATLISCDITLPAGTGIINCRVDGEHKQIRF